MHRFRRIGFGAAIGAAVSIWLAGCQSARPTGPQTIEADPVPAPEAPVAPVPSDPAPPTVEEAETRSPRPERGAERGERTGRAAKSFAAQAERYGAAVTKVSEGAEWQASKGNRLLTLTESSRLATLDGVSVYLDHAFGQRRGRWSLSDSDEALILASAFGDRAADGRKVRTIVLDPGHGGTEEGTRNEGLGLLEKHLNLDVCERLGAHLEKLGYRVTFTRYDDRLVPLEARAQLANGVNADVFVSVHFNAALNREAIGLETYLLTPAGQPSTSRLVAGDDAVAYPGNQYDLANFELAFRIQKAMLARLQRDDRGVRKSRFVVLRDLQCPGVLVECGFLSNPDESLLVSTPVYREKLARTLAEAIDGYARNSPLAEL